MHPKHFYELGKKSVTAWLDDYAPSMGAAISYYTVFSIAPFDISVACLLKMKRAKTCRQGEFP